MAYLSFNFRLVKIPKENKPNKEYKYSQLLLK
jgi:hypothetical protein